MSQIKGSKLSSKLEFVRAVYGGPAIDRVIDALPVAERDEMRDIIDLRWYPSEMYDDLVQAICAVLAGGDPAIYDQMGVHTAEHQLSNIYAAFRRQDLIKMIRNMVPMHSHMNTPAHMQVETDEDSCTIIVDEPKSSTVACRIARAFYRRTAELAGAKGVDVTEETCSSRGDDACRFRVQWTH